MWSDDEDDDESRTARDHAYEVAPGNASGLQSSSRQPHPRFNQEPASGTTLTGTSQPPVVDWMKDWIDERVWRFFSEIEGFHLGSLDTMGRSPSRYEKLKQRWDAFLRDFDALAPFVAQTEVDRPHFDTSAREWVDEVYTAPVVTDAALWDAFCAKWKLESLISYEDLAALTEHARMVLAAHPRPRFQKASLQDLSPDIIHLIYAQLTETPKDAHGLASASTSIRKIGCKYIFKTRDVVIGKDGVYHNISAISLGEIDAEIRAKMTVDRDRFLQHVRFLVSRPDICGLIQRLRVANNWGNLNLVETHRICLIHQEDAEMFDPVKRALDELLSRVSVKRLDLEYLPLDLDIVHRICAQEKLVEAHLTDCMVVPWEVEQGLLNDLPSPVLSNIRYLSFTDLPIGPTSMWSLLTVCPQLCSLQVTARSRADGFQIPASGVLAILCPQLRSLQRLELHGLSWDGAALFVGWLDAAGAAALRLDHLALVFNSKIGDDAAELVLRALHRGAAPLRTLVLDGLTFDTDGTAVLELIGGLFPQLEGLTLGHRVGEQWESWPSNWPLAPAAYAARLGALSRLRCFGANIDREDSRIEGAEPESVGQDEGEGGSEDEDEDDDRFARRYRALIAPFAAACPSLVYFVVPNPAGRPEDIFRITPAKDGPPDVEPVLESASDIADVARLYNPSRLLRFD